MRPKLVAVVVGPTTLAVLLAFLSAISSGNALSGYQRSVALLQLDVSATALADTLQQERDVTIGQVAGNRRSTDSAVKAARTATDRAVGTYRNAVAGFNNPDQALRDQFDSADAALNGLGYVRNAVDDSGLTLGAIVGTYSDIIGSLSNLVSYVPVQDSRVAGDIRVLGDFFAFQEYTSQLRGELADVLTSGTFDVGQLQDFINLLGQQQVSLNSFRADGTEAERTLYSDTVQGPVMSQVETIEDDSIQAATAAHLPQDPQTWFTASSKKLDLLHTVRAKLIGALSDDIGQLDDSATRTFLLAIAALLVAVLISVVMSIVVARSISSQLKNLLTSATHVAKSWLPEVMRRLRRTTVEPFTDFQISKMDVISRSEIGDVANAFNEVTSACLQLAREQSDLRSSMNTALINLARRNQNCVNRMLRALDDWEKDEMNADSLQRFFVLDHLVTRMRRTDDSLLVIAGAQAGSNRHQDSALDEVVSAALSEIEQYARVNRVSAGAITVSGSAVIDIVHLLAELLDNATKFSPTTSKVDLSFETSRSATDGVVIVIRDHGRGMTKEQFAEANELMTSSVEDIVSSSMRTMGHLVVARLAARHSIDVQLRPARGKGVIVAVTLPRWTLVSVPRSAPSLVRRSAGSATGPASAGSATSSTGRTHPGSSVPWTPPAGIGSGSASSTGATTASSAGASAGSASPESTDELPSTPGLPPAKVFSLEECLSIRRRWREQDD